MTGEDLIRAIESNKELMKLDNCPAVPAQMSCAVYGAVQDDVGNDVITNDANMKRQIDQAILFNHDRSQTAVWHFDIAGSAVPPARPAVHHFVVIPWYKPSQGTAIYPKVYTVFMAYEKKYIVDSYVKHTNPAPSGSKGYKKEWTENDLSTMLSDLLTQRNAWEDYFGKVGPDQAVTIRYYKYRTTTLDSAVSKVKQYSKPCKQKTT